MTGNTTIAQGAIGRRMKGHHLR